MSNNTKRVGSQTIELKSKPRIIATYSVVGPREGQGPLKKNILIKYCKMTVMDVKALKRLKVV